MSRVGQNCEHNTYESSEINWDNLGWRVKKG